MAAGRVVVTSHKLVYPQTLGIYVKKDAEDTYQALVKALAESKANGEYAAMLKTYDLEPVSE